MPSSSNRDQARPLCPECGATDRDPNRAAKSQRPARIIPLLVAGALATALIWVSAANVESQAITFTPAAYAPPLKDWISIGDIRSWARQGAPDDRLETSLRFLVEPTHANALEDSDNLTIATYPSERVVSRGQHFVWPGILYLSSRITGPVEQAVARRAQLPDIRSLRSVRLSASELSLSDGNSWCKLSFTSIAQCIVMVWIVWIAADWLTRGIAHLCSGTGLISKNGSIDMLIRLSCCLLVFAALNIDFALRGEGKPQAHPISLPSTLASSHGTHIVTRKELRELLEAPFDSQRAARLLESLLRSDKAEVEHLVCASFHSTSDVIDLTAQRFGWPNQWLHTYSAARSRELLQAGFIGFYCDEFRWIASSADGNRVDRGGAIGIGAISYCLILIAIVHRLTAQTIRLIARRRARNRIVQNRCPYCGYQLAQLSDAASA